MRRTLAGCLLTVVNSATPVFASDGVSEQIVVVRLPSQASQITVSHQRGDAVVLLEAIDPPSGLVKTLEAQTGRFFRRAEHREMVGRRAVVALELSSEAVEISTKRVSKTPAIILTFEASANPLHPDHRSLFGAVPGVFEVGRLPLPLPPEAGDAPCPGRIANDRLAWAVPAEHVDERFSLISDPYCAEYLASRLAMEAANSGRSLAPFERWAYNFDPSRVWSDHRRSHALVALVVGGVLARTAYYPEAEVVFGESRLFRPRSLRYYQALGMAHLELVRGRESEVRAIVDPLLESSAPDEVKAQGAIVMMLASTRVGQAEDALRAAERAWAAISDPPAAGGRVAALAGEVALADGKTRVAERWFEHAFSSEDGEPRRAAALRLADFWARRGAFRRAKRVLARVDPVTACEEALVGLRRRVMAMQEADEVLRFLEQTVQKPVCPAELREARFALAQTYVQVGLPEMAVPLAWQLRDELPIDYQHTNEPLPLLQRAFRAAAARLVRHQRWEGLTQLYAEHVAGRDALELLDGPSLLQVARAHVEAGAPETASNILTTRLAQGVDQTSRRAISSLLLEAYLEAEDAYRADLVLKHMDREFAEISDYVTALGRAQLALLEDKPSDAIRHALSVETPSGDPTSERLETLGRAYFEVGRLDDSARAYLSALRQPMPTELEHPEIIIRILSECAREPAAAPCADLYREAKEVVPLGERLRAHAQRLGWDDGTAAHPDQPRKGLAEMLMERNKEKTP